LWWYFKVIEFFLNRANWRSNKYGRVGVGAWRRQSTRCNQKI